MIEKTVIGQLLLMKKKQPSKTSFSDELNPEFSKNWKNYPTPKVSSKTNP